MGIILIAKMNKTLALLLVATLVGIYAVTEIQELGNANADAAKSSDVATSDDARTMTLVRMLAVAVGLSSVLLVLSRCRPALTQPEMMKKMMSLVRTMALAVVVALSSPLLVLSPCRPAPTQPVTTRRMRCKHIKWSRSKR